MRAVVQRVLSASVEVEGRITGRTNQGLLVLLGVAKGDDDSDAKWLAEKIANLRIFSDGDGKMNLSVLDIGGCILSVSQFTLYGDVVRGRRPGFDKAASADEASRLYSVFNEFLQQHGCKVETGVFQSYMKVSLVNDGPVTFVIDTPQNSK